MWMAYVTEVKITNLESGVKNLHQTFSNLMFDADHESIYGVGRAYSPYSTEECINLAKKYGRGVEACDLFLEGKICLHGFVTLLEKEKLDGYLYRIRKYIPSVLYQFDEVDDDDEMK